MDSIEYEFIKSRLNSPEDVRVLHEKMGLPEDMLYNILGRKIVRKTMRDFYRIKKITPVLLRRWQGRKPILNIAREMDFPPVLTASFILAGLKFSKRQIRLYIQNPNAAEGRLQKELKEAVEADFIYSPWATNIQFKNGREAEAKIKKWLDERGVEYITERQAKATHRRTPDFLLKKKMKKDGVEINWIESKASFGSPNEIKRNHRKQLADYVKHFGPGLVVYWYGFVEDAEPLPKIIIVDAVFFHS